VAALPFLRCAVRRTLENDFSGHYLPYLNEDGRLFDEGQYTSIGWEHNTLLYLKLGDDRFGAGRGAESTMK